MDRSWGISEWQVFSPNFETHMKLRFNFPCRIDLSVPKNTVVKHRSPYQGTVFFNKPRTKDLPSWELTYPLKSPF